VIFWILVLAVFFIGEIAWHVRDTGQRMERKLDEILGPK
jgi:hypothetical protein